MNIGNVNLDITTNDSSIIDDIQIPSSHSLHTNWGYFNHNTTSINGSIILENIQRDIEVILSSGSLTIIGDIDFSKNIGFNPQFLTTGNKGIVSKFISHICEKSGIVSLHACGLYNRKTGEIKIGIGTSGSGKTALISTGIEAGWEVISTEMLQINEDGEILPGNTYDVIGLNAAHFFKEQSYLDISVFGDDKIFDQTGSKCLADLSKYKISDGQKLSIYNSEIVFLQFGSEKFKNSPCVTDNDMSLRFIAHSASEKIETPTVLGNDLIDISMYGDISFRNKIIHMLNTKISSKVILGGNIDDFRRFLDSH